MPRTAMSASMRYRLSSTSPGENFAESANSKAQSSPPRPPAEGPRFPRDSAPSERPGVGVAGLRVGAVRSLSALDAIRIDRHVHHHVVAVFLAAAALRVVGRADEIAGGQVARDDGLAVVAGLGV